jgi:hypothetical protein
VPRAIVVGDAHTDDSQQGSALERFDALGNKIAEEQPDYIILIGDFMSMKCLSPWEKNKRKKMEGLRYDKEVVVANEALDRMQRPTWELQERQRAAKKRVYQPTWVYIEGNHEYWLTLYFEYDPTFSTSHSVPKDLKLDERGFVWVPYKEHYEIDGVAFTHVPIQGNGKPVGNPNVCQKALKLYSCSVVFGHTHTLNVDGEHRHRAAHLNQALCVGCFFEHVDDYAKGSRTDYWRGIVDLDIYSTNRFKFTCTPMSLLKQEYLYPYQVEEAA